MCAGFGRPCLWSTGSVRGVSVRLLAACSANGDAFLQYLCSSSDKELSTFCSSSLSTDSVELAFAEANLSIGHTATAQQLLLHLRRIDICACIKKKPVYTFTARGFPKKALSSERATTGQDALPHTLTLISTCLLHNQQQLLYVLVPPGRYKRCRQPVQHTRLQSLSDTL